MTDNKNEEELLKKELEAVQDNTETQGVGQRSVLRAILSWVKYIIIAIILSILIITFVAQRTDVDGHSMNPALQDKDALIIDKITYKFSKPKRFDIIVFPYPGDENTNYIKRIIGLPGEAVEIKNGYVYINGKKLDEKFGKEKMEYGGTIENRGIMLEDDEYFVLGDNRNNSKDSRFEDVGLIKRDKIIGRAWLRLFPNFGLIKHKDGDKLN